MSADRVDVSTLSDEQVSSLLALGSSGRLRGEQAAVSPAGLLQQAMDDPGGARLQTLIDDLKRDVLEGDGGPLSFRRLTETPDDLADEFAGKTFAKLLMADDTSRRALEYLARYGEILSEPLFSEATQLTGAVIRSFAQTALTQHHNVEFTSAESESAGHFAARLSPSVRDSG